MVVSSSDSVVVAAAVVVAASVVVAAAVVVATSFTKYQKCLLLLAYVYILNIYFHVLLVG